MDETQPPLPLVVAMLLAIGGSIAVWSLVFSRLRAGQPIVPRQPRRPVPWHVGHVIAIVLIYVATQITVVAIVMSAYRIVLPGVGAEALLDDEGGIAPEMLAPVLLANAMANLIVVGMAIGLLGITARATSRDYGFLPLRPSDIPLGFLAFLASLLPVYAIQVVLTQFFPSQHPVQQLLTSDSSGAMLLLAGFSAVIVAPVAEEFLFRGILQGWLEAAMTRHHRQDEAESRTADPQAETPPSAVAAEVVDPPDNSAASFATLHANPYESPAFAPPVQDTAIPDTSDEPRTRIERMLPIGVSSLLFALMHLGNGPDPIPLFVLAVILGYLYQQTHRLWPCIVLHMCLNATSLAMLLATLPAN